MRFNLLKSRAFFAALMFFVHLQLSGLHAQVKTNLVRGVVLSNIGEPLTGVSVIIRNPKANFSSGTSTDSSGVFTFSTIPAGGPYSFTFSNVGFENQTLAGYNIRENLTLPLEVKMIPTNASLDQVVVVGYGTQLPVGQRRLYWVRSI